MNNNNSIHKYFSRSNLQYFIKVQTSCISVGFGVAFQFPRHSRVMKHERSLDVPMFSLKTAGSFLPTCYCRPDSLDLETKEKMDRGCLDASKMLDLVGYFPR